MKLLDHPGTTRRRSRHARTAAFFAVLIAFGVLAVSSGEGHVRVGAAIGIVVAGAVACVLLARTRAGATGAVVVLLGTIAYFFGPSLVASQVDVAAKACTQHGSPPLYGVLDWRYFPVAGWECNLSNGTSTYIGWWAELPPGFE